MGWRGFIMFGALVLFACAPQDRMSTLRGDGFSVRYVPSMFKEEPHPGWFPFGEATYVAGKRLVHTVPMEHCDLSGLPGSCTPETTDIAIGFFVVPKRFDQIVALREEWQDEGAVTAGGTTGFRFTVGVEGENTHFTFLPLDATRTLMIARDSIDENILIGYKDAPGFFPLAEQERIFNDVLATLTFEPSSGTLMPITLVFPSVSDIDNAVFEHPVTIIRYVPKNTRSADTALRALFAGPLMHEKMRRVLPDQPDLQSLADDYIGVTIENGIAMVNFRPGALELLNGSAATQEVVKFPIAATLNIFPTVREVRFAIDGVEFTEWDA